MLEERRGPIVDFEDSTVELEGVTYSLASLTQGDADAVETYSVSVADRRLGTVSDTNGALTVVAEADVSAETLRRVGTAWFVAVGMSMCGPEAGE